MTEGDHKAQLEKTGRPNGKRGKFSFRVTSELRDKLEAASIQYGRPVSEEIELRLEKSFWNEDIVSDLIDRASIGGADAAYNAIKKLSGGEHYLLFGVNIATAYKSVENSTASESDPRAWLIDEMKSKILIEAMKQIVEEFLDTIRRSHALLGSENMDQITQLMEIEAERQAEELRKAGETAKQGAKRKRRSLK